MSGVAFRSDAAEVMEAWEQYKSHAEDIRERRIGMTREDSRSRTEADAAHFAAIAGASEHIGGPVGDQEPNPLLAKALGPDPWGLPNPKPTTPIAPSEPPF